MKIATGAFKAREELLRVRDRARFRNRSGRPGNRPASVTIPKVRRVEVIWTSILGVALILLGLMLLLSPEIPYVRSRRIGDSPYSVKSDRFFVVPRPAAGLIIAAGVATLIIATRKPKP